MKIGFTGTRHGTTCEQHKALCAWIKANAAAITELHHGCCIGADSEAEDAFGVWAPAAKRHARPSTLTGLTSSSALHDSNVRHEPKPPLHRNYDIVDACDVLVACPKEADEQRRSGTWATIRYARKIGRKIVMVCPDGTVIE